MFYNLIGLPAYWLGFAIFSIFNRKARLGFLGRQGTFKQLEEAVPLFKGKKILFIHSSSSGEWEQAAPIVQRLKKDYPELYIIASFFSYSGMKNVKSPHIDLKIYLPFDSIFNARRFFELVQPQVWLISKYDVWPNFTFAAYRNNITTILASAELAEDSARYKGVNKLTNRSFYPLLTHILPKSADDKSRFEKICPAYPSFQVTGDARFDQIYQKAQNALQEDKLSIFDYSPEKILIGGSMWPADEKHLLPAMARCLQENKALSLIIAPHELHEDHIVAIETFFAQKGISSERFTSFSKTKGTEARVAIIDTIGLLAKIYRITDVAYVGGSFSSGVHNTMEPAAFGQAVVFGPKYKNAHEACELIRIKAGFSIKNKDEAYSVFTSLLTDENERLQCGNKARSFLKENLGAADKTVDLIKKYL